MWLSEKAAWIYDKGLFLHLLLNIFCWWCLCNFWKVFKRAVLSFSVNITYSRLIIFPCYHQLQVKFIAGLLLLTSVRVLHTKMRGIKTEFSLVLNDNFVPPIADSSIFGSNSFEGFSFADLARNTEGFAFGTKGLLQLVHFIKLLFLIW